MQTKRVSADNTTLPPQSQRVQQNCFLLPIQKAFVVLSEQHQLYYYRTDHDSKEAVANVSDIVFLRLRREQQNAENDQKTQIIEKLEQKDPLSQQALSLAVHPFDEDCKVHALYSSSQVFAGMYSTQKQATLYAQDLGLNLYHFETVQTVKLCPFASQHLAVLTNKRLLIFDLGQDVRHPVHQKFIQPSTMGRNAVRGLSQSSSDRNFVDFDFGVNRSLKCEDFTNLTMFFVSGEGQIASLAFHNEKFFYPPHYQQFLEQKWREMSLYLGLATNDIATESAEEVRACKLNFLYENNDSRRQKKSQDTALQLVRVRDVDIHIFLVLYQFRVEVLFSTIPIEIDSNVPLDEQPWFIEKLVRVANVNFPEIPAPMTVRGQPLQRQKDFGRVHWVGEGAKRGTYLFELLEAVYYLDVQWLFEVNDFLYDQERLETISNTTELKLLMSQANPAEKRLVGAQTQYGELVCLFYDVKNKINHLKLTNITFFGMKDELVDLISSFKGEENELLSNALSKIEKTTVLQNAAQPEQQVAGEVFVSEQNVQNEAEMLALMDKYGDLLEKQKNLVNIQYEEYKNKSQKFKHIWHSYHLSIEKYLKFYEGLDGRFKDCEQMNEKLLNDTNKYLRQLGTNKADQFQLCNRQLEQELFVCEQMLEELNSELQLTQSKLESNRYNQFNYQRNSGLLDEPEVYGDDSYLKISLIQAVEKASQQESQIKKRLTEQYERNEPLFND